MGGGRGASKMAEGVSLEREEESQDFCIGT